MSSSQTIAPKAVEIRLLNGADAPAMHQLRMTMLTDAPECFAASVEDEHALSVNEWAARIGPDDNSFIVGAFVNGELHGSVGVFRNAMFKYSHKVTFWGVFVTPALRRTGAAKRLLTTAIEQCRQLPDVLQVTLTLTGSNTPAFTLYQSLGFHLWGEEPNALRINGKLYAEKHMCLDLGGTVAFDRG